MTKFGGFSDQEYRELFQTQRKANRLLSDAIERILQPPPNIFIKIKDFRDLKNALAYKALLEMEI